MLGKRCELIEKKVSQTVTTPDGDALHVEYTEESEGGETSREVVVLNDYDRVMMGLPPEVARAVAQAILNVTPCDEEAGDDIPSWLLDNDECPPSREEFIAVSNRLRLTRKAGGGTAYIENVTSHHKIQEDVVCTTVEKNGERIEGDWWEWNSSEWRVYTGPDL
jgi:hypothetical protein